MLNLNKSGILISFCLKIYTLEWANLTELVDSFFCTVRYVEFLNMEIMELRWRREQKKRQKKR